MTRDVTTGAVIGPYKIGPQLNSGGMGMVFKAQKTLENGEAINVAIKFPRLAVVHDEDILQGFFNEAETMSKFRCSRIPKIDTWGVHEGLPYVVMELVTGVSLKEFLDTLTSKKRQLDFELAAHIFREVALALHYAHTFTYAGRPMNVLHRDMAAKNVMIDRSGDVYLIDFGVVRSEDTLQKGASSASIVKGTLNYLAPEHAAGDPSAASDVFGLHAILWEMLEGRAFRTGFSERQLWAEVMQGNVPPLTRADVPPFLRTLIEMGLHPDPEERIRLADALTLLEEHSKPRNTALRTLFARHFEFLARRSGSTIVDEGFEVPSELFKTMAAAKAVNSPLGLPRFDAAEILPKPESPPDPASELPTVAPRRPATDPGLPLALSRDEDDDERPPRTIEPPPTNDPTPIPATEFLLPPTNVDPRDERGYTVPLMAALDEPPSLRAATQMLPTPPEVPTTPANAEEEMLAPRATRRWPLLLAGIIGTVGLAVLSAFFIIDDTTENTPSTATASETPTSSARAIDRVAEPDPPSPAPLEIPSTPKERPEPEPKPAPVPAPAPAPAPSPEQAAPAVDPIDDPEPEAPREDKPNNQSAVGTSTLTLRAGFNRAEVQVRGKTIELSSKKTLKVRAGSVKIRWRFPPSETWSHKRLHLKKGRSYVVQVEKSGLRIQEGRR